MNATIEALKAVQNIQGEDSNPNKTKVRYAIRQQIEAFAKQQGRLSMVSLPATEWLIERELLESSKANNLPCSITGLEKNPAKHAIFDEAKQNKPHGKNVKLFNEDFDAFVEATATNHTKYNAFWADYCGCFKAGFGMDFETKYPHIACFFHEAKTLSNPFLYYLTFSLNGRIKGGRKGKNTLKFAQEVKNVFQNYCIYYRLTNIIPIMSVIYKGAGRQNMITIGFAVNMGKTQNGQFWQYLNDLPASFPFSPFKAKWLTNGNETPKETIKVSQCTSQWETNDEDDEDNAHDKALRSKAIKALYNAKIPNADIATLLNLTRNQVGSVLAWHCNPESFK